MLLLLIASAAPAQEMPDTVRVRILNAVHPSMIRVKAEKGRILMPDGPRHFEGECLLKWNSGMVAILIGGKQSAADMVRIEAVKLFIDAPGKPKRIYEGAVEISAADRELCIVNETGFERYVHGAAWSEAGELLKKDPSAAAGWEHEFLSAMEICIRSYLAASGSRHRENGYSFCDLTHCVHFAGTADGESVSSGTIMTDRKERPVVGFFHSTCGGTLTHPSVFWKGIPSECYRSGDDSDGGKVQCLASPHASWTSVVYGKDMDDIVGCDAVDISAAVNEGRVESLIITTGASEKRISAAEFISLAGRKLGWNVIKSNDFTVTRADAGFRFEGRGLGHGVGLCQYGAAARAKKGWKAERILQFYFPGTKLKTGTIK